MQRAFAQATRTTGRCYAQASSWRQQRIVLRCTIPLGRHNVHNTPSLAVKADKKKRAKRDDDDGSTVKSRKGELSTEHLIPGSKQLLEGENQVEYEKTEGKMRTAVEWFKKQVSTMETRGTGRVTPDLVDSLPVSLSGGKTAKLNDIATIGVRDGTTLVVTVFEERVRKLEKVLVSPTSN